MSYINEHLEWIVEGKPYFAFAGEVHNSSASTETYMNNTIWPSVDKLNLNTLLIPVYWELIEPIKGTYDFSLIKNHLQNAEKRNIKIIFLWFGLWKNGLSTYVPQWIKLDSKIHYAQTEEGTILNSVSPSCNHAIQLDAKALSKVCNFLKLHDQKQTVIAFQVENEIGLLGSVRDYSEPALKKYKEVIPKEIRSALALKNLYWDEIEETYPGEAFMVSQYASAIEVIAAKARAEYDIVYFVNAWIEKGSNRAGTYPSGGPIARYLPLWRVLTPSLDLYAPDIYERDYALYAEAYLSLEQALLVPETRMDVASLSNIFWSIAANPLIGYAPFGIEDCILYDSSENPDMSYLMQLSLSKGAFNPDNSLYYLNKSYELLNQLYPLISKAKREQTILAFKRLDQPVQTLPFMGYDIVITTHDKPNSMNSAGFIIKLANDEFLVVGTNFTYEFCMKDKLVLILDLEEILISENEFKTIRHLNGDERYFPYLGKTPGIHRIKTTYK